MKVPFSLLLLSYLAVLPSAPLRAQDPDWRSILDAPSGTACTVAGTVRQERQFATTGDSCVRLQSEGASLTAAATGPAIVSFRWRSSNEEGMDYCAFSAGQGELLRLSGRTGWKNSGLLAIGSGNRDLIWHLTSPSPITCGDDAAWVDNLSISPVAVVTAAEALDYAGGVTISAEGVPALWGAWAADGTDAVAVPGSSQLTASITMPGPGWLRWRARGNSSVSNPPFTQETDPLGPPASNGWSEGRRAWIPWAGTVTLYANGGLDTLSRDSGPAVSLSEAADAVAGWTSFGAYPIRMPELARDGDDFIALSQGYVTVPVVGPMVVSFGYFASTVFTVDGVDNVLETDLSWHQETVVLGPGAHTLKWQGYNNSVARLDTLKAETLTTVAAALDYAGPVTTAGAVAGASAAAHSHDGQDALMIALNGSTAVAVTGPGRLQFRCRSHNLPLEVRAGSRVLTSMTPASWQAVQVDVPPGNHTVTLAAGTLPDWFDPAVSFLSLDELSYETGAPARISTALGAPADHWWVVSSPEPLAPVPDPSAPGGVKLTASAPTSASGFSSFLVAGGSAAELLALRVRAAAGCRVMRYADVVLPGPLPETGGIRLPAAEGWQETGLDLITGLVSSVTFEWTGFPGGTVWELTGAGVGNALGPSMAQATENNFVWTDVTAGWAARRSSFARVDGDVLLACGTSASQPAVTAAFTGPGILTFARLGPVRAELDGVILANGLAHVTKDENYGRFSLPVSAGSHTLKFSLVNTETTLTCGLLDDVRLEPWTGATLPAVESENIQFATGSALNMSEWPNAAGATSHDTVDSIFNTSRDTYFSAVDGPGFLTWWWKSENTTGAEEMTVSSGGRSVRDPRGQWSPAILEIKGTGFQPVTWWTTQPQGFLDEVRFAPLQTVSVAEAIDTTVVPLTASADWRGYAGPGLSIEGTDALGLSTSATGSHTLTGSVTGPGTLTFWWRRARIGPSAVTPGTFSFMLDATTALLPESGYGYWTWQVVNVPAGSHTLTWTATGSPAQLSGNVWLDDLRWTPNALAATLPQALDDPNLNVANSGWSAAEMSSAWDSTDCAYTVFGTTSAPARTMQMNVEGPAEIRCRIMVGGSNLPAIEWRLDGALKSKAAENAHFRWQEFRMPVPVGSHTVQWNMPFISGGAGFVDQVSVSSFTETTATAALDTIDLENLSAASVVADTNPAAAHDGVDSLVFPPSGTPLSMLARVAGGSRISFWWRAEQESSARLEFVVNEAVAAALPGNQEWQQFAMDLPPGPDRVHLEWRTAGGAVSTSAFRLDEMSITPAPAQISLEDALDASGWLANLEPHGAGWRTVAAPTADGVDAVCSFGGAALIEMDVTGPGIVMFDWAALNLEVELDGVTVPPGSNDGVAPFTVGGTAQLPWSSYGGALVERGYRTFLLEVPTGAHRLRLESTGMLFLDRFRKFEGNVPPAAWPPYTRTSFYTSGEASLVHEFDSRASYGLCSLIRHSAVAGPAETALSLPGPGTLTFRWSTEGATHRILLDDLDVQGIRGGNPDGWDYRLEIPPGLHVMRIVLGSPGTSPVPLRIHELSYEPQRPFSAAIPGVIWSTVGRAWVPSSRGIAAPAGGTTNSSYLHAHFFGPAIVRWKARTLGWTSLTLNGETLASFASNGGVLGRYFYVGQDWCALEWNHETDQLIEDVTLERFETVPVLGTLDASLGIVFTPPPTGTRWTGLHLPGAGLTSDNAAFFSTGNILSAEPLEATVTGPATLLYEWGAVPLMRATLARLAVGGNVVVEQSIASSGEAVRQSCMVDIPAGVQTISWTAGTVYVDNVRLVPAPVRLGAVLDAANLAFSLVSRDGTPATTLIRQDGALNANGSLRLPGNPNGAAALSELCAQLPVPGILRWQERTDASPVWQQREAIVSAPGRFSIPRPNDSMAQWLDGFSFSPTGWLPEAIEAPELPWTFTGKWSVSTANTADGVDSAALSAAGKAETEVTGPGQFHGRVRLGSGTVNFRLDGESVSSVSQLSGTFSIFTVNVPAGNHRITVELAAAAGSTDIPFFYLDTIAWAPDHPVPSAESSLTDEDGDGLPALLEAAFALDPLRPALPRYATASTPGLPAQSLYHDAASGQDFLEIIYPRLTGAPFLYSPEFSTDSPGGWIPAAPAACEWLGSPDCVWEIWRVRDAVPVQPGTRRFGRVRVTRE